MPATAPTAGEPEHERPPAARARAAPRVAAALVVLAVLAAFFAPALSSGAQLLFRDNGRMHWPVKRYVAERLRAGHLPEWNPYAGLGAPLVAGAVDAVQHPFGLLLAALPFPLAFKLWALLSYALAAAGACAWARRLGRSWPASVAAGLGFALSGALVGSSDNLTYLTTLAAVPWMFWAAHRWLERPGPGALAAVGLASGLCAAGGDPQAWGFALLLVVLYPLVFTRRERSRGRDLLRGAEAAGAALAGAAPFVLPVLAWLPESSRGGGLDPGELERWNLPLARLAELALPHLYRDAPGALSSGVYTTYGGTAAGGIPWVSSVYVGAGLLALALLAARRSPPARWLLGAAAAFTAMALGPATLLGRGLAHLPVLSGFRYWEKMAVWPALLVPVAAAFGLDLAPEAGRRAGRAVAGLGALLLLAQAALRSWPEALPALLRVPGAPSGAEARLADNLLDGALHAGLAALALGVALALAASGRGRLRRGAAVALAAVAVADVFAANLGGYQLADPRIVDVRSPFADAVRGEPGLQRVLTPFPLDPARFPDLRPFESQWLQAATALEPCFALDARIGNFLPYTGMVPARADRYRRRLRFDQQLPHAGLFGVGWLVVPGSAEGAARVGARPPYDVAASAPALPAVLVRVPHRPRAYLAGELTSVDRRGAMEFALAADPASPASVVEGPVPAAYRPPAGSARVVTDEPERVGVETASDGPALLVLNDIYAAGWTAAVDGRPAAIAAANYLGRGVWVEAGAHRVEFRYRTPWLREGWAVFLVGGAAAIAAAVLRARRRRRA